MADISSIMNTPQHPLTYLVALLSKNGAIILNADGVIEWSNPAFSTLTGYSLDELQGAIPGDLLLGEHSDPNTIRYMEEKIAQKEPFTSEILNYRKDGSPFWVSLQYHPVGEGDAVTNFVAVVVDLTEQRKNQEALRESESRFRHLANSAPALIWMINERGELDFHNEAWRDFTGVDLQEGGAKRFREFVHTDDQEAWKEVLNTALGTKAEFEVETRLRHQDGSYRTMLHRGNPRLAENGSFLGFIGSSLDITEIMEANEKLRDSQNKLNAFFNSTTDTNFLLGGPPEYPVLAFNKMASDAIKGLFQRDVHLGDSFLDYTVDEVKPKFVVDMERALHGETVHEERKVAYENDMVVYWRATYKPAYDQQQNIIGVAFNVTNIDAQRKYEIALENQNQRLEEIAHLQSHEIRRPVASLLGLINLLRPENFDAEDRALVEMMHNTVHEMDNIIHRVVELTYETENQKPFNPNEHDSGRTNMEG
ncbi:MAG: PAS domain S-box protein [Bacteroidota bacterium]